MRGSSWDKKLPKDSWIREIVKEEGMDPAKVLLVGDDRTEIKVGVEMGGITISRLPKEDKRQREIQIGLGTHIIVTDYLDPAIKAIIYEG